MRKQDDNAGAENNSPKDNVVDTKPYFLHNKTPEANVLANEAKFVDTEKFAIRIIYEFLMSYELNRTLEIFKEELQGGGYELPNPLPFLRERIRKDNISRLTEHFVKNEMLPFFNAWETFIPLSIRQKLEYKKLTFYLHVHFAVLPLRHKTTVKKSDNTCGDNTVLEKSNHDHISPSHRRLTNEVLSNQGMEFLKHFLENKGTEFSEEPEFLPYYALPFVNSPSTHPSFQELFKEDWTLNLTSNLRSFLLEYCWGSTVCPEILSICYEYKQLNNSQERKKVDENMKISNQLVELNKNYKLLKRKYHKLHKDHHNLISVAAELTGALENSAKGNAIDLTTTLNNCTKIFPELFQKHAELNITTEADPEESFKSNHNENQQASSASQGMFDLDFKKIKSHLVMGSMKTKLFLLQALRWRITHSSADDHDFTVGSYIRHDLLCLGPNAEGLLDSYLTPSNLSTPHPIQQSMARLVNALASFRIGRDYLSSDKKKFLNVIVCCLTGKTSSKIDPITSDMLLATLQKLSLRREQRLLMVEMGIVEWLIRRLVNETDKLKPYSLEYSTALLMNLCLHKQAKEHCIPLAKMALTLLADLLGTQVVQVVPYVNGTLYSLLACHPINQEAKRIGLATILEYYYNHSKGEMQKQLEYILKLHREDCHVEQSSSPDELVDDDTEEIDLLEEELDADDPVRNIHGELVGEGLLYQEYRLLFPYHSVVHPSSSATQVAQPLARPVTPRSRSSIQKTINNSSTEVSSLCTNAHLEEEEEEEEEEESFPEETQSVDVGNIENEQDKEVDAEIASVMKDDSVDLSDEKISGGTDEHIDVAPSSSAPPSSSLLDGCEEYLQAFRSRPRIPRTPTFMGT